jgi:hypothetical protein
MTQYKSIAGPIGLTAESDQGYEDAVKKYAAIIDENAVGGWELLWIQQIPVTKEKVNIGSLIIIAVICAAIGAGIGVAAAGFRQIINGIVGGILIGGFVGIAIGYAVSKSNVIEFFNMLIFAKKN